MYQQVNSIGAPGVIKSVPISVLELGKIQSLNLPAGAPKGSISANAANFIWANCQRIIVKYEGNAPSTIGGKILFVSSPVPLTDDNFLGYITNRQMAGGKWPGDVREFNVADFSSANGKAVGNFQLNIIHGDRPIGINNKPGDVSPILTYFSIVQWTIDTNMQQGGTPSASSSTSMVYDSIAINRLFTLDYHVNMNWVYRCGGQNNTSNVVQSEEETVQQRQTNVGTTTSGVGFATKRGGPAISLIPPDLGSQAVNSVDMFGNGRMFGNAIDLQTTGLDLKFIGADSYNGNNYFWIENSVTGEIISFVVSTAVSAFFSAIGTPTAGALASVVMPYVCQAVIAGFEMMWAFMAREVGTPSTVQQKTKALDAANNSLDGPISGETALTGFTNPNYSTFTGFSNGPYTTANYDIWAQAGRAPADSVAGRLNYLKQVCLFQGLYPIMMISNGAPAPTVNGNVNQQMYEVVEGGVDALYPTVAGTYTDPSSDFVGIPAVFQKMGQKPGPHPRVYHGSVPEFIPPNQGMRRVLYNFTYTAPPVPPMSKGSSSSSVPAPTPTSGPKLGIAQIYYDDPGYDPIPPLDQIGSDGVRFSAVPDEGYNTVLRFLTEFFNASPTFDDANDLVVFPVDISYVLIGRLPMAVFSEDQSNNDWFPMSKTADARGLQGGDWTGQTGHLQKVTTGRLIGLFKLYTTIVFADYAESWNLINLHSIWDVSEHSTMFEANGERRFRPFGYGASGDDVSVFHVLPRF